MDIHADRQVDKETASQPASQSDSQSDSQTARQTDSQPVRQPDSQTASQPARQVAVPTCTGKPWHSLVPAWLPHYSWGWPWDSAHSCQSEMLLLSRPGGWERDGRGDFEGKGSRLSKRKCGATIILTLHSFSVPGRTVGWQQVLDWDQGLPYCFQLSVSSSHTQSRPREKRKEIQITFTCIDRQLKYYDSIPSCGWLCAIILSQTLPWPPDWLSVS